MEQSHHPNAHRAALRFLKKHREAFEQMPLAVFVMAMNLTQSGDTSGERFGVMKVTVS